MVIRRGARYADEPPQGVLASFRRTYRQALGHGLMLGVIAGAALAGATFVAVVVRWIAGGGSPRYFAVWLVLGFLVPLIVGALAGAWLGIRLGADADDLGVRSVPAGGVTGWPAIADIRVERRRARTVIALYLINGRTVRLPAPYDGEYLAHDPSFERKYFTLLNLWETHRNWRNRP